jgi:hypothetical protein
MMTYQLQQRSVLLRHALHNACGMPPHNMCTPTGMNILDIYRGILQDLKLKHTIALRYRRVAHCDVSVDGFG